MSKPVFQSNSHCPEARADALRGFRLHESHFPNKGVLLLVPVEVKEQIDADLEALRLREVEELRQAEIVRDGRLRLARERTEAEARLAAEERVSSSSAKRAIAPAAIPFGLPSRPPNTVPVFDWKAAKERVRSLENNPGSGDREVVKRDLRHFEAAMANGPWRLIASATDWKKSLPELALEMPNFAPVVTFIARRLALAALSKTPLQPPPILLLGDPGVGKTYFAQRLAEALRTVVYRQAFDDIQGKGALRGSDRYWGNTSVGALWELIMLGTHANPVVILDELDKGATGSNGFRPVDQLLTLLEPVTSICVKDQSVNFEFDASYVWYIATANDAKLISAPIRSRFTEFVVEAPDIEGRLVLAKSIYAATLKRLVPSKRIRSRFKGLTNTQICRLAWLTPRKIRMTSESVLGAAALSGRWHVEDSDLDEALKPAEGGGTKSLRRKDEGDDPGSSVALGARP